MGVGLPPFGLLTNELDRFALRFESVPSLGCIGITEAPLGVVLRLVAQVFRELGKLGLNVRIQAVLQLVHDDSPVIVTACYRSLLGRIAPQAQHAVLTESPA